MLILMIQWFLTSKRLKIRNDYNSMFRINKKNKKTAQKKKRKMKTEFVFKIDIS